MTYVKQDDIRKAVEESGIKEGDMVLVHSSYKSLGFVDGGAESVIAGILDVIGKEGTLVFPTFCQKDFEDSYKTWHLDKASDVGYLTNYFRKRKGSTRSDQATHSVAACGKKGKWLTQTHGHTQKRFSEFGDTAFAPDSPWEKMYQSNAKVMLLGVGALYITFRHYAESLYIEECLKKIEKHKMYPEMKDRLQQFNKPGVWPHLKNVWLVQQLEEYGLVNKSRCGNAIITSIPVKEFVDFSVECLNRGEINALTAGAKVEWIDAWQEWRKDFEKIVKET